MRSVYHSLPPGGKLFCRFLDASKVQDRSGSLFSNSIFPSKEAILYELFGARIVKQYLVDDVKRALKLSGFLLEPECVPTGPFIPVSYEHVTTTLVVKKESGTDYHMLPKVSYCLIAYKPEFFAEALDSVLRQTYPNFEVVISDDDESGEIERIVSSYIKESPFIRYFRNRPRLGGMKNACQVLKLATGDYIKYIYDDDLYEPDLTHTLVCHLEALSDVAVLAVCGRDLINVNGQRIHDVPTSYPILQQNAVLDGISIVDKILASSMNNLGEPMAALFPKKSVTLENPFQVYEVGVQASLDFVLFMRLLCQGHCVYIPKRLVHLRQHGQQETWSEEAQFNIHYVWFGMIKLAKALGFLKDPSNYKSALINVTQLLYNFLVQRAARLNQQEVEKIEKAISWLCNEIKLIPEPPTVPELKYQLIYSD
ncbi:MAG: glycosyltransferase family 2 protein [Deltaproteobacteria bacterium]|nr:glycosyltransferase family 2 protein [Deltaproteobacteria bacterium]